MLNYSANGPSGYNLTNSLRFRSSASAYLSRTPASSTNRQIWTWSGWIKRGLLTDATSDWRIFSARNSSDYTLLSFRKTTTTPNALYLEDSSTGINIITTQYFRDPSAWYHVVVAIDTTQATAANRVKIYINGSQVTSFSTASYPTLNGNTWMNNNVPHGIGIDIYSGDQFFDGYMTEVNFIDGQALTPSSFGNTNSTTGVWQPAKYTGSYGTNGYYLNFNSIALTSGSNTGLGKDNSGNGNYWNTNNISVTAGVTYDAMTDVPTLTSATVANYPTLNPLRYGTGSGSTTTISEANLKFSSSGNAGSILGTMNIPSSGKWYWEAVVPTQTYNFMMVGVIKNQETLANLNGAIGYLSTGYAVYTYSGQKINNGSNVTYMAAPAQNTVVTIAYDADTGSLYVGAGGSWANGSGSTNQAFATASAAYTGITGDISPAISFDTGNAIINFGQRPFTYTAPSGYLPLNTFNLPSSTIPQGNKYMDATLYTGTGASLAVTNTAGFKPDFVWGKDRAQAQSHLLFDSVRGVYNFLSSNSTSAESTNSTTLTAFNSNGFQLGTNATLNQSGISFVGWQWQAGQGSSSSNTSGSITSTVSVNATAGFSVVTYTGTGANATVGHGLGVAPKMIIFKGRSTTFDWMVYHTSLGNTNYLRLNQTNASAASSSAFNNTSPTSTVFSLGDGSLGNQGSSTQVAYCWAEIAGFSKFGSYTGNLSNDGPFVYCGFRPKFIMIKSTGTANDWMIFDSARPSYNLTNLVLYADLSLAEGTGTIYDVIDILSNGFKIRGSNNAVNASGTLIFMAFAANPFKNSNAF